MKVAPEAQVSGASEQIDWAAVEERTKDSPYARAFNSLARDLGVAA